MIIKELLKPNVRCKSGEVLDLTRRKEPEVEATPATRGTTTRVSRRRLQLPNAERVLLKEIGYPFRLRGDPRPSSLEIDSPELFSDYVREQWLGCIVRKGTYLFDKYVMPDFAFQVVDVEPENSVITRDTIIAVHSETSEIASRVASNISLDDVIGHDQVRQKCRLILKYLQNPQQFGEWAPRAILFYGWSGTGKTMTARAIAAEANARIFLVRAPDLIGLYVGEGGRRISALFEEARKSAPCVVFIDEVDAIGLARSFQSIRGDVAELVTTLLSELDRNTENSGVVVIGATNALSLIDPAIRSRFDTAFEFKLPTLDERKRILELYTKRLPIPFEVNIDSLAVKTDGLSGRDLRERILKESLHIAIYENRQSITEDLVQRVLSSIIRSDTRVGYII